MGIILRFVCFEPFLASGQSVELQLICGPVQFCGMVQNCRMRASITLDEDVHLLASNYARAKGITLGDAIGEMIRKADAEPPPGPDIRRSPNGLPCLPPNGKVLTPRMVKEAEGEFD
jgi:hypothetical protein